jgi:hypothetical protein
MQRSRRREVDIDNNPAKLLTLEELRAVSGGQIIDKYNQTAKGIIDSIGR